VRRAVELDQLSLRANAFYATTLFQPARVLIARLTNTNHHWIGTEFALAHEGLGDAYEQKGMQKEAIAEWSKALTLLSGATNRHLCWNDPLPRPGSMRRSAPWQNSAWKN
jgi:hypothetical protein